MNEYLNHIKSKLIKRRVRAIKHSFAQGMQQSQDYCQQITNLLNEQLEQAHKLKIDTVLVSVQEIIQQHLQKHPKIIIFMAKKILKNIAQHTDIELCAHPCDALILANALPEITQEGSAYRNISIIKDQTLERGSLIAKANKSIIDAQISTQLNRTRDILLA